MRVRETTSLLAAGLLPVAALLFLTIAAGGGIAHGAIPEGRAIRFVGFQPAAQPFTDDELAAITQIKPGSPYSLRSVRTAIQKLFATGRYVDIVVDAREDSEGVDLTFQTEAAYFVSRVTVNGAKDPPNEGQLSGSTKLQLGAPFQDSDMQPALDNMQERLRANGFYQASILPEVIRDPLRQTAQIAFLLDPGKRAHFDGVNVAGSTNELSYNALIRATGWKRFFGLMGWRTVTEARVRNGLDHVQEYFQDQDLLLSRVSLQRLEYKQKSNTVTPHLHIEPGPKVELRASGEKMSRGKLRQFVPIFQERSLDRDLLVEGRRNLLEYFQSPGFFDAQVGFELLPKQGDKQVVEYV
ncbi:MAG: hypothetical protein JST65_05215, partial [Acidobacteria bacterium]|nr:hypothetical protein [Acidobacteriota bacterium]